MEDVETIHANDTALPDDAPLPPAAETEAGAADDAGAEAAIAAGETGSATQGGAQAGDDTAEAAWDGGDAGAVLEAEFGGEDDDAVFDDVLVAEAIEPAASIDPDDRLKAIIEAAIYVTDEPLSAEQIAKALDQPLPTVQGLLARLVADYALPSRGLAVREVAGGYKMATKPEHHEDIRKFVRNLQPVFKLSLAALETLAVIAYKQPVTAPEIMEIRGVQGAGVLKTLLDRKLIATAGRKDVLGKPILYKTTKEFLLHFGLSSLAELPTLKEFEELGRLALSDSMTPEPPGERGDANAGAPWNAGATALDENESAGAEAEEPATDADAGATATEPYAAPAAEEEGNAASESPHANG